MHPHSQMAPEQQQRQRRAQQRRQRRGKGISPLLLLLAAAALVLQLQGANAFLLPLLPTAAITRRTVAMVSGAAGGGVQTTLEPLAGAWAGWECHFTCGFNDGGKPPVIKRIPDSYLPSALVEWEVEVWGWEGHCLDRAVAEGDDDGCVTLSVTLTSMGLGCMLTCVYGVYETGRRRWSGWRRASWWRQAAAARTWERMCVGG